MAAKANAGGSPPPATQKPARTASAAALAIAATYRAFDPALSDDELQTIARQIDEYRKAGAALDPKAKPLRNSDEMVARFRADASRAI